MSATELQLENSGLTDLAGAVARRELRPDELLESVLKRIQRLEPSIQAWSYLDADAARREAESLTSEIRQGRRRGALHGVPVAIKDEFHVQGMPTGMRGPGPQPPEKRDATVVARLRAAGAIILGKTHMPLAGQVVPTCNPWNLEHTAGGTSSGSGAAVGARMVPLAVGEQTMGSNLRPAAYCGVPGMKPTYGRISRFGCLPFAWSLDHVGLIGLSFEDLAFALSIVAGPDELDPTCLPDPAPPSELLMQTYRPPRIGLVRNFFLDRCETVMVEAVESCATRLRSAGAAVSDLLLPPEFELTWTADRIVSAAEGATFHAARHDSADYTESASTGSAGRSGALIPATYYLQSRRIRSWLNDILHASVFDQVDVLLMAAAPGPAPRRPSTGSAVCLVPWSFLGLPAIAVPCGLSDGLPLGLQLVAAHKQDYELLRAGAWCESVLGRLPAPTLVV